MYEMKRAFIVLLLITCASAESPIAQDMLTAHNAIRARLKIAPLTWSDKIADQAQQWADKLLTEKQLTHRPNSPYGENLFEISGAPGSAGQVLNEWNSEARDYDYSSNKCSKVCGHYTQVVWAASKQVGCAVARDSKREVWVCNYDPPGNYVGQRPY